MGQTRVTARVWPCCVTLSVHGKVLLAGCFLEVFLGSDGANSSRLHPRDSPPGTSRGTVLPPPRAGSAWYGPDCAPRRAAVVRSAHAQCRARRSAGAVFTARTRRPGLSRNEPNRAELSRAEPNRAELRRDEPKRAELNGAEPNVTEPSRTEPSHPLRYRFCPESRNKLPFSAVPGQGSPWRCSEGEQPHFCALCTVLSLPRASVL